MLGDLAMIIADPFACMIIDTNDRTIASSRALTTRSCGTAHTLIRNIFVYLEAVVEREAIPKDDERLKYITHLLALGLQARSMIRDQNFRLPRPEKEVMQTFFPLLASRIRTSSIRSMHHRACAALTRTCA